MQPQYISYEILHRKYYTGNITQEILRKKYYAGNARHIIRDRGIGQKILAIFPILNKFGARLMLYFNATLYKPRKPIFRKRESRVGSQWQKG